MNKTDKFQKRMIIWLVIFPAIISIIAIGLSIPPMEVTEYNGVLTDVQASAGGVGHTDIIKLTLDNKTVIIIQDDSFNVQSLHLWHTYEIRVKEDNILESIKMLN